MEISFKSHGAPLMAVIALALSLGTLAYTPFKDIGDERQWEVITENTRLVEVRKDASRATNKRITNLEKNGKAYDELMFGLTGAVRELSVNTRELTKVMLVVNDNQERLNKLEKGGR